jgi:hypothetical protein
MNREPRKAGCRTSEQGGDAGNNGSFNSWFTTSRRVDVREHFQKLKPQSLPETFTGRNKRYATWSCASGIAYLFESSLSRSFLGATFSNHCYRATAFMPLQPPTI